MTIATFALFVLLYTACHAIAITNCAPGSFENGEGDCELCAPGTFQDDRGKTSCKPCRNNTFTLHPGKTSCTSCGPYGKATKSHTACSCKPGAVPQRFDHFSLIAASVLPSTQEEICKPCPAGTALGVRENRRPPQCFQCFMGTYQPKAGQSSCLDCPSDSRTTPDGKQCLRCSRGTIPLMNFSCGVCPSGKRPTPVYPARLSCEICEPGTFKKEAGNHGCTRCPKYRFSNHDGTRCKACPPNTLPIEDHLGRGLKCGKCGQGEYAKIHTQDGVRVYAECYPCEDGTYQPDRNLLSRCKKCRGRNSFVAYKGDSCIKCAKGTLLMRDDTCRSCPPGTYYEAYSWKCSTCSSESYSEGSLSSNFRRDASGAGGCQRCPSGTNSLRGASSCVRCPKGQFFMSNGSCAACSPGTEYNKYVRRCLGCDPGNFSVGTLSPFYKGCRKCRKGTYSLRNASRCIRCPKNQRLKKDGTCGTCPPGSGYDEAANWCDKCRPGYFSQGTISQGQINICSSCPFGSFSLPGATKCVWCREGNALIWRSDGTTECGTCPAGFRYNPDQVRCEKCKRGITSKPNIATSCPSCRGGKKANKIHTACV